MRATPNAAIVSLDGQSAYSISLAAVHCNPRRPSAVCALGACRARTRLDVLFWWDDDGPWHEIHQAEGVGHGDSLALALYAPGQYDALVEFLASPPWRAHAPAGRGGVPQSQRFAVGVLPPGIAELGSKVCKGRPQTEHGFFVFGVQSAMNRAR